MAKSKRKRKLKEEDFKKKKLKVGKKLPMPDNVTKTSFKAHSIKIVQQTTSQDGDEPVNFKRQTLKEILSSCSHYNTQAREEALVSLRNLIEKHPSILKDNLNNILQRILDKITDIEGSIRQAFLSLIFSMFTALPEADIVPFFPSVLAYLCSAMTHLNEGVRLDSLKFLDHCLQFYPQLLCTNPKNIILNFVNVISTQKDGQSVSRSTGVPGVLSLKAKVTSQKTQLQVLTRLNRLLRVIFEMYNDGGSSGVSGGHVGGIHSGNAGLDGGDAVGGSVEINGGSGYGFSEQGVGGIFGINGGNNHKIGCGVDVPSGNSFLVSNFSLNSTSSGLSTMHTSSLDLVRNEIKLMEFISSLSPVLIEYWVECCPAEFTVNLIPISKMSVSLKIMKEVLEIFLTLVCNLEIISDQEAFVKFLQEKLFAHFYGHFVSVFPMSFTIQNANSKKVRKNESSENISDIFLNILICQLLSYFIPHTNQDGRSFPKWVSEVLHYVTTIVLQKAHRKTSHSQMNLTDVKSLAKLVKVLILNLPRGLDDKKVKLLKSMVQLFEATRAMSSTKKVLLQCLTGVLRNVDHREMSLDMKVTLDGWLCASLKIINQKELGSGIVQDVILVCKTGILLGFPTIATAIQEFLPSIFQPQTFTRFDESTQLLVIEILYQLHQIPSQDLFKVFSVLCNSGTLSLKVFQYLMEILHLVSNRGVVDQELVSALPNYFSFILSVLVGAPQKKLSELQTEKLSCCYCHPVSQGFVLITELKDFAGGGSQDTVALTKDWQYQKSMTNTICQYLVLSDFSRNIPQLMEPCLKKLFSQYPILPLPVVYRLLFMAKTLCSLEKEDGEEGNGVLQELLVYIAKWCAIIWHFTLSSISDSKYEEYFKAIAKDLKSVAGELCNISYHTLKNVLDLFISYTSCASYNCSLTCQVLVDMQKVPLDALHDTFQPCLKNITENLEKALEAGLVDSQILADFMYKNSFTALRALQFKH